MIASHRFLRGPNLYADVSGIVVALRATEELAPLWQEAPPDAGGLADCAGRDDGADVLMLIAGARAGLGDGADGWAMTLAIAERAQASFALTPARGRILRRREDQISVFVPADHPRVGLAAFELGLWLTLEMRGAGGPEAAQQAIAKRSRFVSIARAFSLDLLTLGIARRAVELGIPVYRATPVGNLVQLGQGRYSRLMRETVLDPQSGHALALARDKWATLARLRTFGLPALPSSMVNDADQAVRVATRMGGPVVVKPAAGGQGAGISLRLSEEADVRQAYRIAAEYGPQVLIEQYAPGADFRLLVVNGRLLAAVERLPAKVCGDGRSTVRQLIDTLNADPRRGPKFEKLLDRVRLDERTEGLLSRQGFALDAVPVKGAEVVITSTSNFSQGGTTIDVTDVVHPDNRVAAETAARACRALVAGVDFISPDISRSWREGGSWILEVNTSPCLRPHWVANPAQDVTTPVVRVAYPQGAPVRVPIAGISGGGDRMTTCRMVADIARIAGRHSALNTGQGTWSGDAMLRAGNHASGHFTADLLSDPAVDMAIAELDPEVLAGGGLGIDALDVAALIEPFGDAAGAAKPDHLARSGAIAVRRARRWVLLGADDLTMPAMAQRMAAGARLGLVSADPGSVALAAHRRAGGFTATIEGRGKGARIVIREGEEVELSTTVPDTAGSLQGMFAACVALKLGLPPNAVVDSLSGVAR